MAKPAKKISTSPMANLKGQLVEISEALKRERADAINLRRRHEAEVRGLRNHLKASVISDLLPVIDNFELAIRHTPKEVEGSNYAKGIESIVRQFEQTLKELGVERIKTVGEVFDPRLHEAADSDEGEGDHHVISQELRSGYKIGDDVIRHAMVKVRQE